MYFKKKSEIVVVIVLTLIVLSSFFLLLKSGNLNGLTGADVIRIQTTEISGCGTLITASETYVLTQNISTGLSIGDCIIIGNNGITLNCAGFKISYAGAVADPGSGVHSLSQSSITIKNCIISGGSNPGPGIMFDGSDGGLIYNNTILVSATDSAGIVLSHSDNNFVNQNNITVSGTGSDAVIINGTSSGNSIINLNATAARFVINDSTLSIYNNQFSYDNEFGQLNVTSNNLTIPTTNLALDLNFFISNNKTGLLDDLSMKQLNASATIKIKGLSYTTTPQLLKNGVRCDTGGGSCTVTSYDYPPGLLAATVTSFSNYTTLEADPPTVSNFKPINGSNFSNQEDVRFNVTVSDGTAVSTVLFMFNSNTTKFNKTTVYISGASPYWNASINMFTLEEKVHEITVFANDTYNNVVQNTKTTIFVDRTAPTVNSYNGSSFNTSDTSFPAYFNFTDNVFSTASCSFYVDGTLKSTNASTFNGTYTKLTWDGTSDLTDHVVSVNCTDGSGNKGNLTILVTVDTVPPNVTFLGPAQSSNFSTGEIPFNASIIDPLPLSAVSFGFYNAYIFGSDNTTYANYTATNVSGVWNVTLNVTHLTEGIRQVRLYARDQVGNINATEKLTFTIDRTAPNITFILPTNGTVQVANFSTGSIELRAEVEDTFTNVTQVIFGFKNSTGELNYTAVFYRDPDYGSIVFYNYTGFGLSVLGEGEYTVSVYATDYATNLNNTASSTINIDRTSPSFTNGTNISTTFYQGTNVVFNITLSDVGGIDQYIFSSTNIAGGLWSNDTVVDIYTPDNDGTNDNKQHNVTITLTKSIVPSSGNQVCWYFWASDTLGNSGNSSVRCFTVLEAGTTGNNPPSGGDGTNGGDGTTPPPSVITPPSTQPTPTDGTQPPPIMIGFDGTTGPTPGDLGTIGIGEGPSTNPISPTVSTTVTISNDGTKEIDLAVDVKDEVKPLENSAAIKQALMEKYQAQGISAEEQQKLAEQELEIIALIEQEDVIQAHTAKITELAEFLPAAFTNLLKDKQATPIWPTGEHVKARLLKSSLVNGEQEEIVIMPGETFQQEIKVKKGLSLDMSKAVHLTFSSGGKEVYQKGLETTEGASIGTAIDIDPENKIFDTYILIPKNTPGKYTLDLEINQKDNGLVNTKPLPFKTNIILNLLKKFSDNIYTETLGPYKVNEEGALLALQMGYDETAFSENYEIVGKLYNNNKLVAVNSFSNK